MTTEDILTQFQARLHIERNLDSRFSCEEDERDLLVNFLDAQPQEVRDQFKEYCEQTVALQKEYWSNVDGNTTVN